jgi:DNA methyltransferase 1-associated protein 1
MDQPPLIPTEQPKLYAHPKARLRHGVRRWHWVAFKNPARTDDALFSHWRCVNDDQNKEYPFAKYNKVYTTTRFYIGSTRNPNKKVGNPKNIKIDSGYF